MIQKLSNASSFVRFIAALGSFFASVAVFVLLFGNITFAVIVMVSVAIHELCHLVAFRTYGIRSGVIFLGFLALTYPIGIELKEARDHVEFINRTFWASPAGIIGNLTLGFFCLYLGRGSSVWYLAAWINFLLAFSNLAPAGGFDGGRIVNAVTNLFYPEREEKAVWTVMAAEALAILGAMQLMKTGIIPEFLGIIVIFFFGMDMFSKLFASQRKDNLSPTEGGLSKEEALKWSQVYFILVSASLVGLFIISTVV